MPPSRPHPLLRLVFRAPVRIYRLRAGWMLGHRFLLLRHIGRRTGLRRETVLEVMEHRPEIPEFIVMSGFGHNAAWLRNIGAGTRAEVMVGHRCFAATYRLLPVDEAANVVAGYERHHRVMAPIVRLVLRRLLDGPYDGSDAARRRLVAKLPLIGFRPQVPH